MVILEPLSFSLVNVSYLSVGTVLVQSEWLNSPPSPVVYGDIVLSIKINTHTKYTFIVFYGHQSKTALLLRY